MYYSLTEIEVDATGWSNNHAGYTDLDRLVADLGRLADGAPKVYFRAMPTVELMAQIRQAWPLLVLLVGDGARHKTMYFVSNGQGNPIRG